MNRIAILVLLIGSMLTPIEQLDLAFQRWAQASREPWMEPAMQGATRIGRPENVMVVLLGVALFGGPAGPVIARHAITVLLPVNLVVEATKYTVGRTRPDGDSKRRNSSFPSSHAANAFAVAWVVAARWRRAAWPAFVVAVLIAGSRIYLNRHFLSDVVAGSLIGVGVAFAVGRWLQVRGESWLHEGRLRKV
ncbi:MAG: phosphatase PAP2 family protein [Candidatus Eisenbacteria bacterium]|uniref:Phosphatase PAP2 family protein n=1 Tax=Eiseniibacteriota bacterium TaxID=2212470 RepID=A0A849SK14_UNCEI|nr:phosphatase PAP2 family protein [Candidatus Eisenbacteria bacterium]